MRVFIAMLLLGACGRIGFDPEGAVSDAVAVDVSADTVSMNAPVGWWKFDEGVGTTAADSSGNQNTGTLVPNGPTWTTGKINGALAFDGVDDWIDIANEVSFDFERTDSFTLAAWVQTMPAAGGDNTILNKFFPGTYTGYWLSLLGGNSVAFTLNGTSAGQELRVTTASGSLTTGTWHHVAVTYAGTSAPSGIHIYIDGVDQALSAPSNNLASSILNDNTIRIGAYPPGGVFYIGGLDDFRIYSFALSQSDVQLLAN